MFTLWLAALMALAAAVSNLLAARHWPPLRWFYVGTAAACLGIAVVYVTLDAGYLAFIPGRGSPWLRAGVITLMVLIGASPWVHRIDPK